jgi:vacuolar-type H+-ATPase subunit H
VMERRPYDTPAGATQREQFKEEGASALDTAAERAKQAGDKASDLAQSAVDKVKQTADDLRSKDAGQIIDDAKAKAAEVGDTAASKVDSAMTATGEQMSTLAQTVREKAPEGKAGEVAAKAADVLDRGGEYLQTADLQMVRSDLERVIREHPIESLLVGVGVGYLVARATRR